ncbi:unnamed protein product, partial [marine sediment metagenome]
MTVKHLSNAEQYKRAVASQAKRSGRTPVDSYNLRRLRRRYGTGPQDYKPGYVVRPKHTTGVVRKTKPT